MTAHNYLHAAHATLHEKHEKEDHRALHVECYPLNKSLAVEQFSNGSGKKIIANPYEVTKAYVLASAEGKLGKHLPYSVGVVFLPDDPELCPQGYSLYRWRLWLDDIRYRSNPTLFREMVEPLDLSKPFDEDKCKAIEAAFNSKKNEAIEMDAVQIEEAGRE